MSCRSTFTSHDSTQRDGVCVAITCPYCAKDILTSMYDEGVQWRQSKNHVVARALEEGKLLYERPA
jgi:hypothetical protein